MIVNKLEYNISKALGLIRESDDSPVPPKLDGKKKKSAEGAHRPDKGTEYTQMELDTQFSHKADERKIK
jgi:hypothetical protein